MIAMKYILVEAVTSVNLNPVSLFAKIQMLPEFRSLKSG